MGLTTDEISANLIELGFTNTSALALYNKIAQSIGIVIDNTITEMANSEANILADITSKNYGKAGYYTAAALAFQLGYNLSQDAYGNPVYTVIDTTAQIISQAAFENLNGNLFLKVATLNAGTGLLQALTNAELIAFQNYFVSFEIPGLPVTIISLPPNILNFTAAATVYATYDFTLLQANLLAALTAFQNSFAFDGIFYTDDLSSYLKTNVPGIRDFYISNTTIDGASFSGSIGLQAGYFDFMTNIIANINFTTI